MIFVLVFVLGAIIGSFFNVVLLRKNTGESIIFMGSRCFSCGKKLAWWQNIPILSFIFLRGRCFYCGSRISWQYPIVEFLVGLLAVAVYWRVWGIGSILIPAPTLFDVSMKGAEKTINHLLFFSAFSALFLVAAYDFRTKIIDSHFLYIFGAFAAVEFLLRYPAGGIAGDLVSSFSIALFFYLLWRFSGGRWMGRGDANLAFFISLFWGWPMNSAALFVSFWLGGAVGILLLIFKSGKFGLKSEIPFGPFMASAAFVVWYFGDFFRELIKAFVL